MTLYIRLELTEQWHNMLVKEAAAREQSIHEFIQWLLFRHWGVEEADSPMDGEP